MKRDIKKIEKWEVPEVDGAPLLVMPNVPPGLFGCLPADAQVLTPNGWQDISTVKEGQVVMCWADGQLFFDQVQGTVKNYYEKAYKIGYQNKRNFDILYSPDHRLPVESVSYSWGRDGRYKYEEPHKVTKVYTAEQFNPKTSRRFYTSARGTGEAHILTDKERVYIAIQADGTLHRTHPTTGLNEYRIKVKKERKAERLRDLLPTSGLKWTELNRANGTFEFAIWTALEAKTFSNVFSYSMGYNKARAFIEEICLWDGHTGAITPFGNEIMDRRYFSTRYDNIEFVQAIASQSGYTSNTTVSKREDEGYSTCYTITFKDQYFRGAGGMKKELTDYNDYMYCITVPSSFFLMKYNNSVVITGNCAPRTIIGQSKWDIIRKKAYMEHDYTCQVSGKVLGHGGCHIHEAYEYDFVNAKAEFKRLICISPEMHNFIHSGRLLTLYKNGEQGALTKMQMLKIAADGFALIDRWNRNHPDEEPLRVSVTFLDWAKHPKLKTSMEALFEHYNVKFAQPYESKRWPIWKLKIGDKVYDSPYRTYEEWAYKYTANGRVKDE